MSPQSVKKDDTRIEATQADNTNNLHLTDIPQETPRMFRNSKGDSGVASEVGGEPPKVGILEVT